MDGLQWKTLLKWMIWGYHYFFETPISHLLDGKRNGKSSTQKGNKGHLWREGDDMEGRCKGGYPKI